MLAVDLAVALVVEGVTVVADVGAHRLDELVDDGAERSRLVELALAELPAILQIRTDHTSRCADGMLTIRPPERTAGGSSTMTGPPRSVSHLLGRPGVSGDGTKDKRDDRPTARLGSYRARDGSPGAAVHLDVDRPHAGLLVGKRGYGKSYTLGVLAEELAGANGVAPVVADPMGVFESLAGLPSYELVSHPYVSADALAPRTWCGLLDLAPTSASGALVWRAAAERETLAEMRESVADADAAREVRRTAQNHLELAASWGIFAADGLTSTDLLGASGTVLDLSGLDRAPANAVVAALARGLYTHCVRGSPERLPWFLLDEAHAFFDGVAESALRTVVTRGRQPGVSFVAATQRPSALPDVAVSQADLLVAHRLTSRADLDALAAARPTYVSESLDTRLPERPGEVVIVDDATESTHALRIRERETSHGGASARAADRP